MTGYIKRSDLAAKLTDLMLSPWASRTNLAYAAGREEALHLIQDMINGEVPDYMKIPAADVVEVVRCKDCIHRPFSTEPGKTSGFAVEAPDWTCPCYNPGDGYYSWVPDDDFFCADGERKEVNNAE